MSDSQLQENLQSDIQTLKHLRLGILPAKQYYKEIAKGWGFVYLCLISVLFFACFFAISINAWPYTKEYAKKVQQIKKDGHALEFINFSRPEEIDAEIQKPFTEKIAQLKEKEKSRHIELMYYMILGVLGTSLFIMLFITSYIKMYVIYKNQIIHHLKTGTYIKGKVWQAYTLFMGCFAFSALIAVSLIDQDFVGVAALLSFIFTAIISSFMIDMEFSRIGISPLTNAIANYFSTKDAQLAQNL